MPYISAVLFQGSLVTLASTPSSRYFYDIYEHVYSHKAAQKKKKKNSTDSSTGAVLDRIFIFVVSNPSIYGRC